MLNNAFNETSMTHQLGVMLLGARLLATIMLYLFVENFQTR